MAEKVTRTMAILAFCHECMGFYQDGKIDCENKVCPLYFYMPYRKQEPNLDWITFNPKRSGKVTWEESKREIDEETRASLIERMEKARESRSNKIDIDENESED